MVRTSLLRRALIVAVACGLALTSAAEARTPAAQRGLGPERRAEVQTEVRTFFRSVWAHLSALLHAGPTEEGSSMDPFGRH